MAGEKIDNPFRTQLPGLINFEALGREANEAASAAQKQISAADTEEGRRAAQRSFIVASCLSGVIEASEKIEKITENVSNGDVTTPEPVIFDGFHQKQTDRLKSTFLNPEGVAKISSELWQRAFEIHGAIVYKYDIKNPDDVNIILIENSAQRGELYICYTAEAGLFRGSWEKIMDPRHEDNYIITLADGTKIDSRTGMTKDLYQKMLEDTKKLDSPLQDTPKSNTQTWLTGEPVIPAPALEEGAAKKAEKNSDTALCAHSTISGKMETRQRHVDISGARPFRFRPVALVGYIEDKTPVDQDS